MIIHFLRTFHSLRNTSNYVWSLSFLSHRMSWNTPLRSLISRPGGLPRALKPEQEGSRPSAGPWQVISRAAFAHLQMGASQPRFHTQVSLEGFGDMTHVSRPAPQWPMSSRSSHCGSEGHRQSKLPLHPTICFLFFFDVKILLSFKELLGLRAAVFSFLQEQWALDAAGPHSVL